MRRWTLILILVMCLGAARTHARQTYIPRFEEAACRVPVAGVGQRCGYLIVPEDRRDPESRLIRLHVAIFPAATPVSEADPLVYLDGGPGGYTLIDTEDYLSMISGLRNRDFILFDQRGVGFSEPVLNCPEIARLNLELLDEPLSPRQSAFLNDGALRGCHRRLVSEGINLSAYNTAANAADLEDLRIALGYEQWNLFGISYGTALALAAMRDFPAGIRSVVLDSVVPLQANWVLEVPQNANRVFRTLFDACAQDSACNARYPGLEARFYELVERLNLEPVTVEIQVEDAGPLNVLMHGDDVMRILFRMLYASQLIPQLPRMIDDAYQGRYEALAAAIYRDTLRDQTFSQGMHLSVVCADETSFYSVDQVNNANTDFPELLGNFSPNYYTYACEIWGVAASGRSETEPVVSSIRTLVLSGEFDPITPPRYGLMAIETLANSYYFKFPGLGHGVMVNDCAQSIMAQFVNDPTRYPDPSCIDAMTGPPFE